MNKKDLVKAISSKTDVSQKNVSAVLDGFVQVVTEALQQGQKVFLSGLGKFEVRKRAARTARNPKTGEVVKVPKRNVAVFKASKNLKESVK